MLKIPGKLPVRTRLPLAAWAVAGIVTLFALLSSLLHAPMLSQAVPHAVQGAQHEDASHQAKV